MATSPPPPPPPPPPAKVVTSLMDDPYVIYVPVTAFALCTQMWRDFYMAISKISNGFFFVKSSDRNLHDQGQRNR